MTNQSLVILLLLSGVILSLHPMLIAVFVALVAGGFGKEHKKPRIFSIALAYMFGLAVVIGLVGFSMSLVLNSLSLEQLAEKGIIWGAIAIIWGLWGVKEYFWYSTHRTPRQKLVALVHNRTMKQNSVGSALVLGFAAAYAALLSLFVPTVTLMIICALLRPLQTGWVVYLVIGLLVPLLVLLLGAMSGLKLSAIIKWKEDNKAVLRLSVGLLNIILGWMLFLMLGGSIGGVL